MVENKNFAWKEIKLYAVYRNMKGCILEANLQGQERQSRMFTILLILGVQTTEKEEAVLEVVLPGRLANDLPWGKHCLPRGTKCRGKL